MATEDDGRGEIYYASHYQDYVFEYLEPDHFDDPKIVDEIKTFRGKKIADAMCGYVYFIDNGKIVFQKSNEELGIDITDLKNVLQKQNLTPIIEQLIREHMPPQESEME